MAEPTSEPDPVVVTVELRRGQAYALAELTKRLHYSDARGLAADEPETDAMIAAVERLRDALEAVGVVVR